MSGIQDFQEFIDDFNGTVATLPTTADPATPWLVDETITLGVPTYTRGTSVAVLTLEATEEVMVVALHFGDALPFDIDSLIRMEFRAKVTATLDSATTVVMGLCSARNDDPDVVGEAAWFKLDGSNAVVVETDDGTTNIDDEATGVSLSDTYKRFVIDFSGGTEDVKFYIDGVQVAGSTTFDMSAYTAGLQPIFQIGKGSDTNANALTIDYVKIVARR